MSDAERKWRIERFEAMGFTHQEASALADSRDFHGVPVYWGNVKKVLDAGVSRPTALDLFVDLPERPATALVIEGSE